MVCTSSTLTFLISSAFSGPFALRVPGDPGPEQQPLETRAVPLELSAVPALTLAVPLLSPACGPNWRYPVVMPNLSALEWPLNPFCSLSPDALGADVHPGQRGQLSPTSSIPSRQLLSLRSLRKSVCISKVQNEGGKKK